MSETTEPHDEDRDPLLERAAAALRVREYARTDARASVVTALRRRRPPRALIGVAAGIILAAGAGLVLHFRAPNAVAAGKTMIEFSFDAPTARDVSVVGEFNGWNDRAAPMQRDAHGTWVTNVALEAGRHVYSFHVNGAVFVPDPRAPVAPEELFGVRHSVLVVPADVTY